ncbi:unnamed protein product [Heterosigma akashiwo]
MSQRYKRVQNVEDDSPNPRSDREEAKKKRSDLIDTINAKIHALFWCAGAGAVMYYTDFIRVMLESDEVNRLYFNLGVVCFGSNCCFMFYLTVYLPYIKKITLSWNIYCPRVIPTMTITGLACGLFLIMGMWPVWGFLTPLILGVVFMGMFFSLHFIPPLPC